MSKPIPAPGTPEARRMYCSCPSEATIERVLEAATKGRKNVKIGRLLDVASRRALLCPLHGNNPKDDLPEGI